MSSDRPPDRSGKLGPRPRSVGTDGDTVVDDSGRIQKMLARAGLGSRRQIEQWMVEGKVFINGRLAKPGDRCGIQDRIIVNGHQINLNKRCSAPTRVLLYHKPVGEVVSRRDPEGRPVIFTQLPKLEAGRWIAVGRLDLNTQGLMLVTTNGELANRMMHPSREFEREYAVRIFGHVNDSLVERMQTGIELEDGVGRFLSVQSAGGEGANQWFHVVVNEGRNRLVRRLWESQGVTVSRLIRIRFGDIPLPPRLKARTFFELPPEDLAVLLQAVGLTEPKARKSPPSGRPARR
jgi:23S rRNA pseudouridine2605 synthase